MKLNLDAFCKVNGFNELAIAVGKLPTNIMDYEIFRPFKRVFEVFSFEPSSKPSKLSYFWSTFHVTFAVLQCVVIYIYSELIFFNYDLIGKSSEMMKYISVFASYFSALYVSFYGKSCYQEILYEIENIEILLEKFHCNINLMNKKLYKKFQLKFFALMLMLLYATVQEPIVKMEEEQSLRFIWAFTFPLYLLNLKHLHSIFYIEMINNYLIVLNEQLCQISEFTNYNEKSLRNKKYNRFLYKKLKLCKSYYNILYNMNEYVNKCMGLFLLANTVNINAQILADIYWITFRIFNQEFGRLNSKKIFYLIRIKLI